MSDSTQVPTEPPGPDAPGESERISVIGETQVASAFAASVGTAEDLIRDSDIRATKAASEIRGTSGAMLLPGSSHGTLRFEEIIGRGGIGEVWEVTQTHLSRTIAIKKIRPNLLKQARAEGWDGRLLEMARAEALVHARLDHPNIVPLYDWWVAPDPEALDLGLQPWIAMKLIHGSNWFEVLNEERGNYTTTEFLSRHLAILVTVARTVAFAHSRGILHTDLKPSQVMVGDYGEIYLMDWGLARASEPSSDSGLPAGVDGPTGTPSYMAPEQQKRVAAGPLSPQTDIYLLGGILYEVITGATPHESDSRRSLDELVEKVEEHMPFLPPDIARLLRKSLAEDPADRYASALDFVRGLEEYLSGAGRRREASAIVALVKADLQELDDNPPSSPGEYEALVETEQTLVRALQLDPDHPTATELFNEVMRRLAMAAIRAGDLRLAEIMALRLPAGDERLQLQQKIEGVEKKRELQRRRFRRSFVISLVSVLATITGLFLHLQYRQAMARAEGLGNFERSAQHTAEHLTHRVEQFTATAIDFRLALQKESIITSETFGRIAAPFLARHADVPFVAEWIPRVRSVDRGDYERLMAAEIAVPGFRIRMPDGSVPPTGPDSPLHFFPLTYVHGREMSPWPIGTDLSGLARSAFVIRRSAQEGTPLFAAPFDMEFGSDSETALRMLLPVYHDAGRTTGTTSHLRGIASLVWPMTTILETGVSSEPTERFSYRLADRTTDKSVLLASIVGARLATTTGRVETVARRFNIKAGGRQWVLTVEIPKDMVEAP